MKISQTGSESQLAGSQITKFPELYCNSDGEPFIRDDKTGVVKFLEKRYPEAVKTVNPLRGAPIIIDAMLDITMKPTIKEITFGNYVKLFKSIKIKPYFKSSRQVCIVFDNPTDDSAK